ncbi:NAD(P)/FAD-dependent oxidoreductase [Alkalimarinus coralli]|uniref:NAD(P)/FAD-dependent oxidoreductase n=1 Tax=Alkalimarinus coralli TaxID=2935863 RepID=UPI00202B8622|nr:NAD(P)/FAD-dependent oxidoreductase [Alkalimarinus coralli]
MNNRSALHHVVIVGGGAGGLELATSLGNSVGRKKQARVTLVDASLTHVWKPLLHEVAAGSMDSSASEVNYRVHAKRHHFEFQLGRMQGLNREEKQVIVEPLYDESGDVVVKARSITYDTLVIAVGSMANDFGTPGAAENCIFLDSLEQARKFHRHLLNNYLKAEYDAEKKLKHSLDIAIIGAGATGVELAAELHLASQELPIYGLSHLKEKDVHISVIEAAERILPALPEHLSSAATRELERLNINVMAGHRVTNISQDEIEFIDGGRLSASIKVWAAGIKAPEFLTQLDGLETNRINQLVVRQDLQTTYDRNIFAFGDCASCPQPGKEFAVPPRAQAAHQQATTLVKSIKLRLKNKQAIPYVYQDRGSLISFSRYSAVGNLMGNLTGKNLMVEGRIARLFYISLYRMHQIALHGFFRTSLIWLSDKINKALHPRLKLH